jgi:hypothetical protein
MRNIFKFSKTSVKLVRCKIIGGVRIWLFNTWDRIKKFFGFNKYVCYACNSSFKTAIDLDKHILNNDRCLAYVRINQNKYIDSNEVLKETHVNNFNKVIVDHRAIQGKKRTHICPSCYFSFYELVELKKHMNIKGICYQRVTDNMDVNEKTRTEKYTEEFEQHILDNPIKDDKAIEEKTLDLVCPSCYGKFNNTDDISNHLFGNIPGEVSPCGNRLQDKMDINDNNRFKRLSKVNMIDFINHVHKLGINPKTINFNKNVNSPTITDTIETNLSPFNYDEYCDISSD